MGWSQGHGKLFDSKWICGLLFPWCKIDVDVFAFVVAALIKCHTKKNTSQSQLWPGWGDWWERNGNATPFLRRRKHLKVSGCFYSFKFTSEASNYCQKKTRKCDIGLATDWFKGCLLYWKYKNMANICPFLYQIAPFSSQALIAQSVHCICSKQ